ncbi:MAG: hypothetical protein O3C45_03845 [Bacteroidetes bacterium]|nr:hypothetical protein [Bacteroidota bacterium]
MKVRLSEDMVRFRLERDEVEALAAGRPVLLRVLPTNEALVLHLQAVQDPGATAESGSGFRIGIPASWLEGWPDSEVVGFDFDLPSGLRVVVEKDFPCVHGEGKPAPPVRMA